MASLIQAEAEKAENLLAVTTAKNSAKVHTDEYSAYHDLKDRGYQHDLEGIITEANGMQPKRRNGLLAKKFSTVKFSRWGAATGNDA